MKQKFIDGNPQKKSRELLEIANQIIAQYKGQGYTLTLRQLYYQLVSKNLILNNEKQYLRLSRILSDGRLMGLVDWDAIEDRLRQIRAVPTWGSPKEILATAIEQYQLDRHQGQRTYIEILLEKEALAQVVTRAANPYQAPVLVNRGYGSTTAMYDIYQRCTSAFLEGKEKAVILYLGDHDPSGLDMVEDIRKRVGMMLESDNNAQHFTVEHIALTKTQIREHNPPPNPAKLTDTRAKKYIEKHGRVSWEIDALPPSVLDRLVEDSILRHLDLSAFQQWEAKEAEQKELMKALLENLRE